VHTDYCGTNAVKKFHRSVGIPPGVKVRYTLINTWRNIAAEPIHNNTLACVDSTSVSPDDFVRFDEPLKYGAVCRDKNGNSLGSCAEQVRRETDQPTERRNEGNGWRETRCSRPAQSDRLKATGSERPAQNDLLRTTGS